MMKFNKIFIVMLMVCVLAYTAYAETAGPNNGGTFEEDTSIGITPWTLFGTPVINAQFSDDQYAIAAAASGAWTSYLLKATNFGFNIPSDTTIQGIVVEIEKKQISAPDTQDNIVKLVKNGIISGDNKADVTTWSGSDTYNSYGASDDLWGLTWNPADINANNFGAVISVNSSGGFCYLDHMRITVYYSAGGDPPESTIPTSLNFTSGDTTNFSAVDVTNVTNLTLAITGKGKIKFPVSTEINAEAEDYDTNIIIEDEFISINTAALDSSFNTSATITLEGVTCPVATITYQEGTFTSKDDIIAGGSNCELDGVCSNIQCIGTNLTFDVAHFTGFAAGADANLTTEAETGVKYTDESIEFYAWYINSTDGTPISSECNISFDDSPATWFEMDYNGSEYNYTKSTGFASVGTHEYNVTCSSANFVTLETNDTKLVSSVNIPEFSTITLGLGLVAVLAGLFVIRRKKSI